jgi:hypothetical protein
MKKVLIGVIIFIVPFVSQAKDLLNIGLVDGL